MTEALPTRLSRRSRWIGVGIALGIVALVGAANAHLVYVSLASQPECVPHLKVPDENGTALRAAKSAC